MKNRIKDKPGTWMNNFRDNPRRKSLYVLLFIVSQLSSVVWFPSCTDYDSPTDEWSGDNPPVELVARVGGHVESRATADNTWDGGEEVAVELNGKHYKFIADAQGKLTPAPGQEIPRWSSPDEVKTVVAWYPYSEKLPETFTVNRDQEYTPYYLNDFLLAPATQISLTGKREIVLRHLLTKVVVNLKAGDGVTENDIRNARLQFCNQPRTSGEIDPAGTIKRKTAGIRRDSIYANVWSIPETGFTATREALLVPQEISKGEVFIKIYQTQLKLYFEYIPQRDDELLLESGKKYIYNITVEREGFSVVRFEESTGWDLEDKELTARTPQPGFKADDTKIFDYYYSDGTRSDGGYRRYTDGTEAWLDIAPTEGKQPIGIVFQTDPARMTQAERSRGWTHGYVVALTACGTHPIHDLNTRFWGTIGDDISGIDRLQSFDACKRFLSGYEATQKVIDAIGGGNADALKDTEYEAFYEVSQYGKTDNTKQYAAPGESSGWYIPSVGQSWDIAENLFGCKLSTTGNAFEGQKQPYARRNISTQLEWIPDAWDFNGSYWTSSIYNSTYAWYLYFDKPNNKIELRNGSKKIRKFVRPVLAF